jgi:hypothetical protein
LFLTLTLLVSRFLAYNSYNVISSNYLAVSAKFFH